MEESGLHVHSLNSYYKCNNVQVINDRWKTAADDNLEMHF